MSYSRFHKTVSFTVVFLFLLLVMHGQSWAGTEADQLQKRLHKQLRSASKPRKRGYMGRKEGGAHGPLPVFESKSRLS